MKKFYCNGKKDFCDRNLNCNANETTQECESYNGEGGEWREEGETSE
jgi:hypothetical protein